MKCEYKKNQWDHCGLTKKTSSLTLLFNFKLALIQIKVHRIGGNFLFVLIFIIYIFKFDLY